MPHFGVFGPSNGCSAAAGIIESMTCRSIILMYMCRKIAKGTSFQGSLTRAELCARISLKLILLRSEEHQPSNTRDTRSQETHYNSIYNKKYYKLYEVN